MFTRDVVNTQPQFPYIWISISLVTGQKCLQFNWDVLPHLPFLSERTSFHQNLFGSLHNVVNDKIFSSIVDVQNAYNYFFSSHVLGIMLLPER